MTSIAVNTFVRLPDGRFAKVIAAPIGTSKYVTVMVEDEPGAGRACLIHIDQLVIA